MKVIKIFVISVILGIFTSCSSSKSSAKSSSKNKLDVLTDFSVALNSNDFNKALNLLAEKEKLELLQGSSTLGPKARMQLKALNLQILIKNKNIKLANGRLEGIVASLPNLDHISEEALQNPTRVQPEVPLETITGETSPEAEADSGAEAGSEADSAAEASSEEQPQDSSLTTPAAPAQDNNPPDAVEAPKEKASVPESEQGNDQPKAQEEPKTEESDDLFLE